MIYDSTTVPNTYHRSRLLSRLDLARWLNLIKDVFPNRNDDLVIDLGCGTGRFSVPIAERLGVQVIGVDPSEKMLKEAAQHTILSNIEYRIGSAESIPVDSGSAGLLFMSNVFHHIQRVEDGLREIARVLRPRGIVFMRNYSKENLGSLLYLRFFPEALSLSAEMLWTRSEMTEAFIKSGFFSLSQGTVDQQASPDFNAYFHKIVSRSYSDLALISDEDFMNGLSRMREQRASLETGPVRESVDYFVFQKRS